MNREELMKLLKEKKGKIDELIFRHLPQKHDTPELDLLYRMASDYPKRAGKGLRGSLCLLACQAFGGEEEKAIPTSAALELFQSWILIRDDIEDDSDERRGEPALHKKYGVPLAINASDALYARMWELLLTNRGTLGKELSLRILKEFVDMTTKTTEGQHIELSWVADNSWSLGEDDYYSMCSKKTSWYTCITPLRLGGIIGGAGEAVLDGFIPFGLNLGVAFQIQDDVLNLIGEKKRYGKEIGGDIWEGKRSLIAIHLLKSVAEKERQEILRIMSKKREEKTKEEVNRVLQLMMSSGSVDRAVTEAKRISREAKAVFEDRLTAIPEGESKNALRAIIDFVVERDL